MWLLLTTVLVNSYSGTVISYLTVPKMKPPIETFDDLTVCENVGLILRQDYVIGKQILVTFSPHSYTYSVWLCHFFFICQEAKTGTLKILGDQLRQYPERLFTDQSQINVRLLTGRFAYPHVYNIHK